MRCVFFVVGVLINNYVVRSSAIVFWFVFSKGRLFGFLAPLRGLHVELFQIFTFYCECTLGVSVTFGAASWQAACGLYGLRLMGQLIPLRFSGPAISGCGSTGALPVLFLIAKFAHLFVDYLLIVGSTSTVRVQQ